MASWDYDQIANAINHIGKDAARINGKKPRLYALPDGDVISVLDSEQAPLSRSMVSSSLGTRMDI